MLTEEKLRQENKQLLEMNRRIEKQKDECQAKLDVFEVKRQEQIAKLHNDMQSLIASRKLAIDELSSRHQSETKLRSEYDACRSLCNKYHADAAQYAERCHTLEEAQAHILTDTNQIRSQLAVTSQLTKDQATQIIDLERRLMQSNELSKTSNQRQTLLEQQLRDLRLTSEKYQISMQGQIEEYSKQNIQLEDKINTLETSNSLLKEELTALQADNECLTLMSKQDKNLSQELQQQLEQLQEQHREENELQQNEIESLRAELNEKNSDQQAYAILKASFTEIEKRCVKHQKTELEVKRQLAVHQKFINDLQREIQDLTERLSAGADEYKTLFRKYTLLERSTKQEKPNTTTDSFYDDEDLDSILRDTQQDQETKNPSTRTSLIDDDDAEVQQCPMCYWEFPQHMNVDTKREHIEHHFQ